MKHTLEIPKRRLKIGTKIKLNASGDEYEITVIRADGEYDIKTLKAPFAWMPDSRTQYTFIKLQDFTIIK